MAEINKNNSGSGPFPGTPSKRAEKKQDTRATPERMKSKGAEMMEIDPEEQGPKTPPRIQSINKDEKAQDKVGMIIAETTGTCTEFVFDIPTPKIGQT